MSRVAAPRARIAVWLLGLLLLTGCSPPPEPPPPPAVGVKAMRVEPAPLQLFREYVGEVSGSRDVVVRSRVGGVLLEKHFRDGALVEEGQLLFTIDSRELQARLSGAEAALGAARANLARAREDVDRYEALLAENAIARQTYDNAVAALEAARAEVEGNAALVEQAALGVEYASIRAPLGGRIGAAQVAVGDLITAGRTALAELSEDDPAWVYFRLSENELLEFIRRPDAGEAGAGRAAPRVQLIFSDGSTYEHTGVINFTDRALDAGTGTYRLRGEFPNPDHRLIPGLFARIRVQVDELEAAITVPDRAVVQLLGRYFVTVVGADGRAEQRPVETGPRQGGLWVIEQGLEPRDRVVVEGIQKAAPGTPLEVQDMRPATEDSA